MNKRLYIACLKENFGFLDFWEKHGQAARDAWVKIQKYYADNNAKDQKFDMIAYELDTVEETLNRFGLRTYAGQWDDCLDILDPATKELPDRLPFDFLDDKPAIILATEWGELKDPGFEWRREPIEWILDELKPHERLLKIDLSRKKRDLLNDFKKYLDNVDRLRGSDDLPKEWADNYQTWTPDTSRERAEAWDQLKVWRMRKERIPFSEIARAMKITQDAAKKAFYKAYERTQGRAYEPDRYRKDGQKINTWDMTKTCQTCPDRQTCTELCPEILRFADQDYTGRKESLDDNGITDFKQYEKWQKTEPF
ncbi:MAG: hypothetical protein K9K63_06080 [Desulfotignum sp.]|nr:hypothetical protein [Desulfotignum sp.]MCF8089591.1 hypothetical protein [Desulfotignum sp.]MCF8136863.1 hypothetical protein [Desulfotignum sp.]